MADQGLYRRGFLPGLWKKQVNCHLNFFLSPNYVIEKSIDLPAVVKSHQKSLNRRTINKRFFIYCSITINQRSERTVFWLSDRARPHPETLWTAPFTFDKFQCVLQVEDLKKQVNLKGREINKRERKSKKDEEQIRFVSRERDAMETKLRKVTEQMEYYKSMMETKWVGL